MHFQFSTILVLSDITMFLFWYFLWRDVWISEFSIQYLENGNELRELLGWCPCSSVMRYTVCRSQNYLGGTIFLVERNVCYVAYG